jgi:hypothetical protein
MSGINRASRLSLRAGAGSVLVAAALIAAGCGSDDGDDPSTLSIEGTGAADAPAFEAPAEADAGATEIEFTNSSDAPELDSQLVFTSEERTDEEVVAELQKAFRGQAVADWFQGGGGPGPTAKGETTTVTQELQEGTYYVVGGEDVPTPPLTKIEVTADGGAELPDADGTVSAVEYSFSSEEPLRSGEQDLLLENDGGTWHHFLASELKPDATIEQAKEYLMSEGEGGGPPPFVGGPGEPSNAVESTVLEGGTSQIVTANLNPGRYAFFCFIADKTGGPPHVVKGMVSEVTVEE